MHVVEARLISLTVVGSIMLLPLFCCVVNSSREGLEVLGCMPEGNGTVYWVDAMPLQPMEEWVVFFIMGSVLTTVLP